MLLATTHKKHVWNKFSPDQLSLWILKWRHQKLKLIRKCSLFRRKQVCLCMDLTGDPHTFISESKCVYRPRYSGVPFYVHATTFWHFQDVKGHWEQITVLIHSPSDLLLEHDNIVTLFWVGYAKKEKRDVLFCCLAVWSHLLTGYSTN